MIEFGCKSNSMSDLKCVWAKIMRFCRHVICHDFYFCVQILDWGCQTFVGGIFCKVRGFFKRCRRISDRSGVDFCKNFKFPCVTKPSSPKQKFEKSLFLQKIYKIMWITGTNETFLQKLFNSKFHLENFVILATGILFEIFSAKILL